MKKAFFIFGIAAFLLPLSMTSCQKEESEPSKNLEIGPDGEIIGRSSH